MSNACIRCDPRVCTIVNRIVFSMHMSATGVEGDIYTMTAYPFESRSFGAEVTWDNNVCF